VTASASASASAAAASTDEKIAGLPKTTFIAIIVVAAIVALAGIGWTVFRKLRLGPSKRFDEKMRPIDFSPHNDALYVPLSLLTVSETDEQLGEIPPSILIKLVCRYAARRIRSRARFETRRWSSRP
jgi:hypothetical protein